MVDVIGLKMLNISSLHLKTALLYYYRFKRQYIVVDECYSNFNEIADILVDTGKNIYEIEIKLSKSDLNQEKRKKKHQEYEEGWKKSQKIKGANKFYICVPTELIPYAEKWIQEINPKYGLIEFNTQYYIERKARYNITEWDKCLRFIKKASRIHSGYNKKLRRNIIERLPSALCNAYINQIQSMERKNV